MDYTEPAGDLNIKLKDYAKFIQFNLQGFNGQNNYRTSKRNQFIHKGIDNYSLGWYSNYENGKKLLTHSGTLGTYYSLVHIDGIKGKAIIVFTNYSN